MEAEGSVGTLAYRPRGRPREGWRGAGVPEVGQTIEFWSDVSEPGAWRTGIVKHIGAQRAYLWLPAASKWELVRPARLAWEASDVLFDAHDSACCMDNLPSGDKFLPGHNLLYKY